MMASSPFWQKLWPMSQVPFAHKLGPVCALKRPSERDVPAWAIKWADGLYGMEISGWGEVKSSLDHNDGQILSTMKWSMVFVKVPLYSMVFQWFLYNYAIAIE